MTKVGRTPHVFSIVATSSMSEPNLGADEGSDRAVVELGYGSGARFWGGRGDREWGGTRGLGGGGGGKGP